MKKYLLLLCLCGSSVLLNAQEPDSCKILPYATASIEGINAKGMIAYDALSKMKRLISDAAGVKIIRYTLSIDCNNCDIITGDVYTDTIPASAITRMNNRNAGYILSFDCITGKDKNGKLFSHTPFLFYIKP